MSYVKKQKAIKRYKKRIVDFYNVDKTCTKISKILILLNLIFSLIVFKCLKTNIVEKRIRKTNNVAKYNKTIQEQ